LGWIVVLMFALAAALRLARFNVADDGPEKPAWQGAYFVGVPVPAGAILVLLPLYLEELGLPKAAMVTPALSLYAGAIAILMVSRIRTFSGKQIGRRIERDYIAPVIALVGLFVAVLATYPYTTLTVCCLLYLGCIPLAMRHYWQTERRISAMPAPVLIHDDSPAPAASAEKPPRHLHS